MKSLLTTGDRQLDLSTPVCMGILNVTPDSFADGAELAKVDSDAFEVDLARTLARAESMVSEGAQILDVGGESTRPGASEISVEEELQRVIPVIEALKANLDVCLSVDTSSPVVIKEAVAAGVHLVNDIRALARDQALDVVSTSNVAVCLMHMQGQPRTMQQDFQYEDVLGEVYAFLSNRLQDCLAAGISKERLLIDPGFGFGKSVDHNFTLLKHLRKFQDLQLPVLVGLSRKSMLGAVTDRSVDQRLAASVAAATLALQGGALVIRSHDVGATVDAIRVYCACNEA